MRISWGGEGEGQGGGDEWGEPWQVTTVESACGPLPLERLGRTLVDEHVLVGLHGHDRWESAESARESVRAGVVASLTQLRSSGVDTIVDTTVLGGGRLPGLQREASAAAGLNVICSTGLPTAADGIPRALAVLDAVRLADILIRELAEAMHGSEQRAGVIAVGAAGETSDFDRAAVAAAAFAHAETGAPVFARSGPDLGDRQAERLMARGVDPERILVTGLGGPGASFESVERLAKRGVRLGFTRIGQANGPDEDGRAALAAYAIRRHGPERVCLSMGSWAYWLAADALPAAMAVDRERGFGALGEFLVRLRQWGISEAQIGESLTRTPLALFGG